MAINPLNRRDPGAWHGQLYEGDLPEHVRKHKEKSKMAQGLPEPQDVVGEWMAKLTTAELIEQFDYYDGKRGYDRGETSVYAYQAARLREEILRREGED